MAIDGDHLVYVQRGECDELRVIDLADGRMRSLGRGTCGAVRQVDVEGDHVAAAVATEPPAGEDSFPSEAWLADLGGGVRIVQEEDAGYGGPDRIAQVALDADALYTVRLGDVRNQVVRIPLDADAAPSTERIMGDAPKVVTRDRARVFVVDAVDELSRSTLLEYGAAGR